jgi:hypothetical protein
MLLIGCGGILLLLVGCVAEALLALVGTGQTEFVNAQ